MLSTPSLLRDQLANRRATAMRGAPEMFAALDDNIAQLAHNGAATRVLAVGATAPDFALLGPDGAQVQLTELLSQGPVVLTFFRGEWCPFCDLTLRALEAAGSDVAVRGAVLVAISPQTLEHSASTSESKGLSFPVLSDVDNVVARKYGLVYPLTPAVRKIYSDRGFELAAFNGNDTADLPMPATFVIDRNAMIRWRFVDPDFTRRAEPAAILAALDELT